MPNELPLSYAIRQQIYWLNIFTSIQSIFNLTAFLYKFHAIMFSQIR